MARFIDAEKIKITTDTMTSDGEVLVPLSAVRMSIAQTPTADVAPKSEVSREIFDAIKEKLIFNEYGIATISNKTFCELKKKYTEESENDR